MDWEDFETHVVRLLEELGKSTSAITGKVDSIMAKIDDLQAALDSIPPVIDAIAVDQAGLVAEIQALKDQIAAGSPVTEAQLQAALDSANAVKARLNAIDASVPATPVP